MQYSKFISALKREDWAIFRGVHFIIPPSLCEDISYVQTPFYHTFTSAQTICRSSKYGLQDIDKRQRIYHLLLKLEENVKLIPSSTEMRHHARKIPLVDTLDRIAKHITLTARPTSHFHVLSHRTLSSYRGGDYVFKRSHSAGFRHVVIPEGNPLDVDDNAVVDPNFDFGDEPRWFIQDMVPLLKQFECRVGICLQRPEEKVIFRKWTGKSTAGDPDGHGIIWDYNDVDALIDISTLQ
jgi:hypothetical protein